MAYVPRTRRFQSGLAAAAIVVVLILAAIVVVIGRGFFSPSLTLTNQAATEANMRLIAEALAEFAAMHKRLPCPASGAAKNGLEVVSTDTINCDFPDGVVPWESLSLRRPASLDGWGRKISYRVFSGTTGLTQPDGASMIYCNSFLRAPISGLGAGNLCQKGVGTSPDGTPPPNTPDQFLDATGRRTMLTVKDHGSDRVGNAFVLISHGETGRGAFEADSTSGRIQTPSDAGKEIINIGTAGVYWALPRSTKDISPDSAEHFDDVLAYMPFEELVGRANLGKRPWPNFRYSATFTFANVAAAAPGLSGENTGQSILDIGAFRISGSTTSGASTIGIRTEGGVTGIGAIGGGSTAADLNSAFGERLTFQVDEVSKFGKVNIALNAFRIVDYFPLQKERAEISLWRAGDTLQTTTVESWDPNGDPTQCLYRLVTGSMYDRVDVAPLVQSGGGGSTRFTVAGIAACPDATSVCTTDVPTAVSCPILPPSATTASATSLSTTGATLNGKVEDNGIAMGTGTGYHVNSASYWYGAQSITLTSGTGTILAGNCLTISGDTTTYVVATGISAPGTLVLAAPGLRDPISSFSFPTITVVPCTTTVAFDYGLTCSYGSSVTASPASINAGAGSTSVSATVGSLACGTVYYFRTRATGRGGITTGNNARFRTSACATPRPAADSLQPTAIEQTKATLLGTVNDNGATTAVTFEYGPTSCYGSSVTATPGSVTAGAGSTAISAVIGDPTHPTTPTLPLACNTWYHYRTRAVSGLGTTVGDDAVFRTLPCP